MPLTAAIERLSSLADVSIGGTVPVPSNVRSHAVRHAKDVEATLRRLLEGTPLRAVKVGDRTFRIVAAPKPMKPFVVRSAPARSPELVKGPDIIVVASKSSQRLATADGNIEVVSFASPLRSYAARGSVGDLLPALPSLSGTRLGRGRDKLFLRGIADSSFAGRMQATLGEYLSEARINYSAPDPGLLLYDVRQLELLKGPQGTLYGGGALGGVFRIEPEKPELSSMSGFVDASQSSTLQGAPGYGFATMLNLPLSAGSAGIRLLGYRRVDGGYIDDVKRGLRDVNRSSTEGFRGQARLKAGAWTLDWLATHQRTSARDSNYAVAGPASLSRASAVAQPSSNQFDLLDLELHGTIGKVDVVSTTSVSRNVVQASYDATVLAGVPATFDDRQHVRAFSHETRASRAREDGLGWVAGVALFAQQDKSRQGIDDMPLVDVNGGYDVGRLDVAAFAETTFRKGSISASAGVRTAYTRARTRSPIEAITYFDLADAQFRVSPMANVVWSGGASNVSLSYREGWRSGSATLFRYSGDAEGFPPGLYLLPFDPDHIRVAALAFSYRGRGSRPLTLQATMSGVDWDHIQSASLDGVGLVYVTNADSANFVNLDATGSWQATSELSVRAGASFSRAFSDSFFEDVSDFLGSKGTIPSVPDVSSYVGVAWTRTFASGVTGGIEGQISYLGRSRLGLDTMNDVRQGDSIESKMALRLSRDRYAVSLEVENLINDGSSVFGYGNPFTLRSERQLTPQRPRTVSLGIHAAF